MTKSPYRQEELVKNKITLFLSPVKGSSLSFYTIVSLVYFPKTMLTDVNNT